MLIYLSYPDSVLKIIFLLVLTLGLILIINYRDSKMMIFRGRSSFGRAPALHAGGKRFESARLHFYYGNRRFKIIIDG